MQLLEKVAVITGGGRGIGRGIVNRFLEEGASVAIVQRSPIDEDLSANTKVKHLSADLRDADSLQKVIDDAVGYFGRIDILVNNAGIMFESSVSEITSEKWDLMMDVNLKAPLFLTQAALPYLRKSGGGSIVNIGSIEGIGANPEHAAYSASKGGIHGMTKALAVDLGADNIRCNAIAPGWIATDLSENYLDGMQDPAAARASLNNLHPVGHVGAATDIGDVAVFLASDSSRFVSGEVLVVDGGRTAKLSAP
ncbi:short-chain dehydrogenase [Corynebacterium stationis]|uniref:SDR family NAD(P)-dependent oxidoreductase n=1 Tax=Corynebacterium stationis TaxID=1705 RepID=UPI000950A4E6|nr:SDR family oxidoreductase [Corynebacterium stationis]APT95569.1 short-chain dehydrogenase [Corynebacterium stationis]